MPTAKFSVMWKAQIPNLILEYDINMKYADTNSMYGYKFYDVCLRISERAHSWLLRADE